MRLLAAAAITLAHNALNDLRIIVPNHAIQGVKALGDIVGIGFFRGVNIPCLASRAFLFAVGFRHGEPCAHMHPHRLICFQPALQHGCFERGGFNIRLIITRFLRCVGAALAGKARAGFALRHAVHTEKQGFIHIATHFPTLSLNRSISRFHAFYLCLAMLVLLSPLNTTTALGNGAEFLESPNFRRPLINRISPRIAKS